MALQLPHRGAATGRACSRAAYLIWKRLPVQHSLAVARRRPDPQRALDREDVRSSVYGVAQGRQLRYVGLAWSWIFLLFTVALAYLYKAPTRRRRRAERAEDVSEPLV